MSLARAVNVPRTCRIHVNPLLIGAARGSRHLGKVSHFLCCLSYDFPRSVYVVSVPVPVPVPVCALVCLVGTDEREQGGQVLGCLVERKGGSHPNAMGEEGCVG